MEKRLNILVLFIVFQLNGIAQKHLTPITVDYKNSEFYVDSVIITQTPISNVIGYSKSDYIFNTKIKFDKPVDIVLNNYLKNNFPFSKEKTSLNVEVKHLEVIYDDQYDIYLTLNFIVNQNQNPPITYTIGSHQSGLIHFELLLSEAFQECFQNFIDLHEDRLSESGVEYSENLILNQLPIIKLITQQNTYQTGKYITLGEFQNNKITKNKNLEMISLNNGKKGYLVKFDGVQEVNAVAICDGTHFYYRIGKRYYKLELSDTTPTPTILINDHLRTINSVVWSAGTSIFAGGTALLFAHPILILPSMGVGALLGHDIAYLLLRRRNKKLVSYEINLLNGKVER